MNNFGCYMFANAGVGGNIGLKNDTRSSQLIYQQPGALRYEGNSRIVSVQHNFLQTYQNYNNYNSRDSRARSESNTRPFNTIENSPKLQRNVTSNALKPDQNERINDVRTSKEFARPNKDCRTPRKKLSKREEEALTTITNLQGMFERDQVSAEQGYPKWKQNAFRSMKSPSRQRVETLSRDMPLEISRMRKHGSQLLDSRSGANTERDISHVTPSYEQDSPTSKRIAEILTKNKKEEKKQISRKRENRPKSISSLNALEEPKSLQEYRNLQEKLGDIERKIKMFKDQYLASIKQDLNEVSNVYSVQKEEKPRVRMPNSNERYRDHSNSHYYNSEIAEPGAGSDTLAFYSSKVVSNSVKHEQPKNPLSNFVTQVNMGSPLRPPKPQQDLPCGKVTQSPSVSTNAVRESLNSLLSIMMVPNQTKGSYSEVPRSQAPTPILMSSFFTFIFKKAEFLASGVKWEQLKQYFGDHLGQLVQGLQLMKPIGPDEYTQLATKRINLTKRPTHVGRKTLIFDLDETLIHCNQSPNEVADVTLPIRLVTGELVMAGIQIRPFAVEVLRELNKYYEVIVFTASHSCYANVVIDYLDPTKELVHHRLYRDNCLLTKEGLYVKDLRILGNRQIEDIIIVDNASYSFGHHLDNGIPIIPYFNDKQDVELQILIPFLISIANVADVRPILRHTFKMNLIQTSTMAEEALRKLAENL